MKIGPSDMSRFESKSTGVLQVRDLTGDFSAFLCIDYYALEVYKVILYSNLSQ